MGQRQSRKISPIQQESHSSADKTNSIGQHQQQNIQEFQKTIRRAIKQITSLIPTNTKKNKKPKTLLKFQQILPESYKFISTQFIPISPRLPKKQCTNSCVLQNKQSGWPSICVGLIVNQFKENQFEIFGSGTLIHGNVILTSAENICSSLKKGHPKNIKFIPGLHGTNHNGIFDVKSVYFPTKYECRKRNNAKYNIAVLQLYENLGDLYGYVGWKPEYTVNRDETIYISGYKMDKQKKQFQLWTTITQFKHISNIQLNFQNNEQDARQGSALVIKDKQNNYYAIGVFSKLANEQILFTDQIRNFINKWTKSVELNLSNANQATNYFKPEFYKQLANYQIQHLNVVDFWHNNMGSQSFKYLCDANWKYLTDINLYCNNIGPKGCKYLKQAKWHQLNYINLSYNFIGDQGCKYIKEAEWTRLNTIFLSNNKIDSQGLKYLKDANWNQLKCIDLSYNEIGAEGCKWLKEVHWPFLMTLHINSNKIEDYGWRYLKDANWQHLIIINLYYNEISMVDHNYIGQLWPCANLL